MANIDTYDEVKVAITNLFDRIGRVDLATYIPEFIELAEKRINRELRVRQQENTETITLVNADKDYALPTGYSQTRELYNNVTKKALKYLPPDVLETVWTSAASGSSRAYTIIGENIVVGPTPSTASGAGDTLTHVYYKDYEHLSDSNTGGTDTLLNRYPDLLIYGAAIEAEPYMSDRDINQVQIWQNAYDRAVQSINEADARGRHYGAPKDMPDHITTMTGAQVTGA